MCISFFDLPIKRQEEIWLETIGYAERSTNARVFWGFRRDRYAEHLAEKYGEMDTADLVAHNADLEEAHKDDPRWTPVIDAVAKELKTRAERGAML